MITRVNSSLATKTRLLTISRTINAFNYSTQIQTKDSDRLKEINLEKDLPKFSKIEQYYFQKIDAQNQKRLEEQRKKKKIGRITGLTLGAIVLGIYFYSMFAVKQETFLDDFELQEPPNPSEPVAKTQK
jgi:ABC-type anion transport system duplicated permease subunit